MLDPRTRTLAILAIALALLTLLSLAGMVGPDRVLAAPHRESLPLPVDVQGQLDQWRTEQASRPRGLLDADAAPAYCRVLALLDGDGPQDPVVLPDLHRLPDWEQAQAAIRHGNRFRPFGRSLDILVADAWLDRAALLGHRLDQACEESLAPHALPWCLVSLHLAADLRRLGAVVFLDAAWRLEESTERLLCTHARALSREGRDWERLLETLPRVRFQGATDAEVARAESLVAMGVFLAIAGVSPFDEARRRWQVAHEPPGAREIQAGIDLLQGYELQVHRLLQDMGDARQRWIYAQWSAELARHCAEASLVVASADQFRAFHGSAERLLGLELSLRATAAGSRGGDLPASAEDLLAEMIEADPTLPRDLAPPTLEWSQERQVVAVHWSSTARFALRAAEMRARQR